jgi:hypothetical protein
MLPDNPDPQRIKPVLEAIQAVWEKYPECGLGQMLVAAACAHTSLTIEEVFYLPDDELVRRLREWDEENKRFLQEWNRRRPN